MSMTKREKILIVIVLILAVFFVYYMYLLKPRLDESEALKLDIENKKQLIATNEMMQQNVNEIDKRNSLFEGRLSQYGGSILEGFDQPSVLVYLADIVSDYADKLTIAFERVNETSHVSINKAMLSMNATYDGLKSVLKSLDEGSYFLKVTGLTVTQERPEEILAGEIAGAEGETSTPEETSEPAENSLNVTMTLEFYNFGADLPPDKQYPFTEGRSYGGDIFY
ncbi:MAG: hypothetical protein ACM3S4_12965 [Burkholderiales bacterium]